MADDSEQHLPIQSEQQPHLTRRVERHRAEIYSGPLPKPSDLQKYDRIVPGAAERIIGMAERQAEHRQFLEKTVVTTDAKRADKGLYVGAFVALCVLGGAVFLIYNGHDAAGATVASLDIVGLVSVFIYGTISRRGEREKKASLITQPPDNSQ